jgi:MinD-like ATPase involved in chromosome partitioning or flagellar assembly
MTGERYGQIISFYSFKGGVGRSMALANIAALLCRSGKSVLVVDWDLEAPGLHKFFEQSSPALKEQVKSQPGVLDMISELSRGKKLRWQECLIDIYIADQTLQLISAGRRDSLYGSRLQNLHWDELYEKFDIGQTFEELREAWKSSFDYILLDSRTGVTDIGDVCTALFPDLLVTVFVANEQNIEGTKLIIERARAVHDELPRDRAKLVILPLLGRDESNTEYELSAAWRNRISETLGFTLSDWLPREVSAFSYFQKVFIPYYSYWSFGENLPVIQREEELGNPTSISSAYARFASLIESQLDWKVLEKGVDSAEINSLRSKASIGEAKSAELEASRLEIEKLAEERRRLQAAARVRQLTAFSATVTFFLLTLLAAGAAFLWTERNNLRNESQTAIEDANSQINAQKMQLSALQNQNSDLLAKLNTTTEQLTAATQQLANQNYTTQQKLDEIIRQNAPHSDNKSSVPPPTVAPLPGPRPF